MVFEAPKGTHDILPAEQAAWRRVVGQAEDVCRLYGYRPIQTPVFEDTEVFARTSGAGSDVVQKEMYTFEDRGGRSLTLRPEATAPIVRAYLEHGMHREPQPVKLYTVAPIYRYSAPQRGRYREHWQLSVEAIGSSDPAVDAELIALYSDLLGRLGVTRYELQLNSIGDRECRPAYVAQLEEWLDAHASDLDDDARQKRATSPLRIFDTKNEALARLLVNAPKIGDSLCAACRSHFDEVRSYLDAFDISYRLVPTLVRGLDYYTRTTFEFVDEAIGAQSSIVGGGRYDYLAEELGGKPTPGVGFGAGIERLLRSLETSGFEAEGEETRTEVFFGHDEHAHRPSVLAQMTTLRRQDISCDAEYAHRSYKGQLTQAKRLNAAFFVYATGDTALVHPRTPGTPVKTDVPIDKIAETIKEMRRP